MKRDNSQRKLANSKMRTESLERILGEDKAETLFNQLEIIQSKNSIIRNNS
jgi:hypothetical protein